MKKYNAPPGNTLIPLLLKRQGELNSLLEMTQAINRNSPSSVLFEMLEIILKGNLRIGKMRLLVKDGDCFNCAAKYGGVCESTKKLQQIYESLQHLKGIKPLANHKNKLLNSYDFFVPVLHKDNMLAFILIGDFDSSTEFLNHDLNFMQTLINIMVVALENKKLFKAHIHRELLQRDIKLASDVQHMLIPLHLPNDHSVRVDALYLPNQNISGDYYDFIRLNEHEFLWCIADVSGKGIAAALLMASLQASIRAGVSEECDLIEIVTKLNHLVYRNTNGERFITLFLAKYDQCTMKMQYINAGHIPPVLLMNGHSFFLRKGTTMIGVFDELPFVNIACIELLADSLIFNYTDGLVESADEDVFITENELIKFLKINQHLPLDVMNKKLLKDIRKAYNAKMDTDDITILSMKIF